MQRNPLPPGLPSTAAAGLLPCLRADSPMKIPLSSPALCHNTYRRNLVSPSRSPPPPYTHAAVASQIYTLFGRQTPPPPP